MSGKRDREKIGAADSQDFQGRCSGPITQPWIQPLQCPGLWEETQVTAGLSGHFFIERRAGLKSHIFSLPHCHPRSLPLVSQFSASLRAPPLPPFSLSLSHQLLPFPWSSPVFPKLGSGDLVPKGRCWNNGGMKRTVSCLFTQRR